MNYLDVRAKIEAIEAMVGDPESAHMKEDELYVAVLRAIANGDTDDPKALATEALRVNNMDFDRWYS